MLEGLTPDITIADKLDAPKPIELTDAEARIDKLLSQCDPNWASLDIQTKKPYLSKVSKDPVLLTKILDKLDPVFAKLPQKQKYQVVNTIQMFEKPLKETSIIDAIVFGLTGGLGGLAEKGALGVAKEIAAAIPKEVASWTAFEYSAEKAREALKNKPWYIKLPAEMLAGGATATAFDAAVSKVVKTAADKLAAGLLKRSLASGSKEEVAKAIERIQKSPSVSQSFKDFVKEASIDDLLKLHAEKAKPEEIALLEGAKLPEELKNDIRLQRILATPEFKRTAEDKAYLESIQQKYGALPELPIEVKPKEVKKIEGATQEPLTEVKPTGKSQVTKSAMPKPSSWEYLLDEAEPYKLIEETDLKPKEVDKYRPFPLMGNKGQFMQLKAFKDLLTTGAKAAAKEGGKIYDAFAGTGLVSNWLMDHLASEGLTAHIIKNEFNPMRVALLKQIFEAPEELERKTKSALEQLVAILDETAHKYINKLKEGLKEVRARIKSLVRSKIEEPEWQLIAQSTQALTKMLEKPLDYSPQVEVREKTGTYYVRNLPKLLSDEYWQNIRKLAELARKHTHEIRQGDAWKFIEEAQPGDFVYLDPGYFDTAVYAGTGKEKKLEGFLELFDEKVMPLHNRGVRVMLSNKWDDRLARELENRGFRVFKVYRRSSGYGKTKLEPEIVAVNYDAAGKVGFDRAVTDDIGRGLREADEATRREVSGSIESVQQGTKGEATRVSEEVSKPTRRIEAEPEALKPKVRLVTEAELKTKEPWKMTFEEYEKEYFRPGSEYNEQVQDIWRTWQKQKLLGQRGRELPFGIKSIKDLLNKVAKDYHRYEIERALKEGKPVPEGVLKDYPDLAEKYGKQIKKMDIDSLIEHYKFLEAQCQENPLPKILEDKGKVFKQIKGYFKSIVKDKAPDLPEEWANRIAALTANDATYLGREFAEQAVENEIKRVRRMLAEEAKKAEKEAVQEATKAPKVTEKEAYELPEYFMFLDEDAEERIKPVEGKVYPFEYRGEQFFAHKVGKEWRVTHKGTGLLVSTGNTKKEAVDLAMQNLNAATDEQFRKAIEKGQRRLQEAIKAKRLIHKETVKNYRTLNIGDYVRAEYQGKTYEGEIISEPKRKGRFVFRMIRTPDGKEVAMPWTPKAKYVKLYVGIDPFEVFKQFKQFAAELAHEHGLHKLADKLGYGKEIEVPDIRIEFLRFPQRIAEEFGKVYPEIKQAVDVQVKREQQANKWASWVDRRVLSLLEKLPKNEKVSLYKLLYRESYTGKKASEAELASLSDNARTAYLRIRQALRKVWKDLWNERKQLLNEWLDNVRIREADKNLMKQALEREDLSILPDEVKKRYPAFVSHLKEIIEARGVPYYMPQSRVSQYVVRVYSPEGKLVASLEVPTRSEAISVAKEINSGNVAKVKKWFDELGVDLPEGVSLEGLKAEPGQLTRTPAEATVGVEPSRLRAIFEAVAEGRLVDRAELFKALADDLDTFLKSRGWSSHLIKRRNIPGFSIDPKDVEDRLARYLYGYGFAKTKREAAIKSYEAFYKLAMRKDKPENLIRYMKQYLDYVFGDPENLHVRRLSRAISLYYLGYRVLSTLTNATQNFTSGLAAYIHHKIPPTYLVKAVKKLATKDLDKLEKRALAELIAKGEVDAQITREMLSTWRTKGLGSFIDAAMLPFRFVEGYVNRMTHFLGAFDYFLNVKKMPYEKAWDNALKVMHEGHFWASRYNRLPIQRGDWGRLLFALQTFTFHYFDLMYKYAKEGDKWALIWLAISPALLGGLTASPELKSALDYLWQKKTGRKLDYDLSKGWLGRALQYGFLGYLSPSLSRSVGVGLPADDPSRMIGGAIQGMYKSFQRFMTLWKRGDRIGAIAELAPPAIRDIIRAARFAKRGVRTYKGLPVSSKGLKPTKAETLLLALGLIPRRIQQAWDRRRISYEIQKQRNEVLQKLATQYWLAETPEEKRKAWDAFRKYRKLIIKRLRESTDKRDRLYYRALLISPNDLRQAIRKFKRSVIGVKKEAQLAAGVR